MANNLSVGLASHVDPVLSDRAWLSVEQCGVVDEVGEISSIPNGVVIVERIVRERDAGDEG